MNGLRKRGLLDLPSEVLRLIAEQLYDPLVLTQQDRLSKLLCRCPTLLTGSMGDLLDGRYVADPAGCIGLSD